VTSHDATADETPNGDEWGDPYLIYTSVAHPARRYNYWLGGTDNFEADRISGDSSAVAFPTVRISALENRRFLRRAVAYLVREAGVRQFLDIGTGIPTADNVHEVAQAIDPTARVVYVDNTIASRVVHNLATPRLCRGEAADAIEGTGMEVT
jgi:S-adenosyl methyltransferase